ncbi:RING/FYVE/PHD zinc finger superfamily protein [Thalictrum thalictroides]|uniref:RING/FYVE/PHD zinc finger superfamily protein n=1 Tax=Thalictrum thalictroides TaxID=46969 RepID=A0A7J6X8I5_THATH|nr:RING/FYVE/PHD zinc finger superfamily protein [Thalictrum thalictroides]
MRSSSAQVCDICGDVGNPKLIATCSNCHQFSEHIYCMHPILHEVPISWYCEVCRWRMVHHDNFPSGDSRKNGGEEVQSSPKRQRTGATENGFLKLPDAHCARVVARILSKRFVPEKVEKVKFLPAEGSCSRPSRANQRSSSLQGGSCSQTNSIGISQHPISKRASVPVAASKFSHENDHAYMSPGYPKSVTHGKMQTISLQKQAVISAQPWQDLKSPEYFPSKSSTSGNFESVAVLGARDERHISNDTHCTPVNNIQNIVHDVQEKCEFKNTSSGLDKRAGMVDSVLSEDYVRKEAPVDAFVCHDNETSESNFLLEVGEEDLPNPPAVNDLPNPPAVHASWKGSFEILNSPSEFYEGFQAYTPGKLSRKAYLVVKEMPEVLQFTLQPRLDTWPEIFHTNSPSGFDIALYFWADDVCRKKYNHLLELMEKQDLSMHSFLNGVELLIFTSRQLPLESQRLSMQFYLWGVFLSSKGKVQHSSDDLKGKQQAVDFPSINSKFCEVMETNKMWREEVIIEKSLPTNYMDAGREWTDIPNYREASMDKSELPNCGAASRERKDMPEPRDASRDRNDTPKSRVASMGGSDMLKSRGACKDRSDMPNPQGASRDREVQSQEKKFRGAFNDSDDTPNSRRAFRDRAVTPNSRRGYMDRSDSSNCRRANKDRRDTSNSRRAYKDTSETPNSRPASRERSDVPNSRGACRDRSNTPITRRRDSLGKSRRAGRERRDMSNSSHRDRSRKSRSASRDRSNTPNSRHRDRSHKSRGACRDRSNAPNSRLRDGSHKSRGACRDRSNAPNSRRRDGSHKSRGAFRYRTDMPSSRRRDRRCKSRGAFTDRNDTPELKFRHRDWSNWPSHGFDKIHSQQPSEERSAAWHLHRDDFDAPGFPTPSEERSAVWHLHQDDFDAPGFPIPIHGLGFTVPIEERSVARHLHHENFDASGFPSPIHGPGFTVPIQERAVGRYLHQGDFDVPPGFPTPINAPGFTAPVDPLSHEVDDLPPGFS